MEFVLLMLCKFVPMVLFVPFALVFALFKICFICIISYVCTCFVGV